MGKKMGNIWWKVLCVMVVLLIAAPFAGAKEVPDLSKKLIKYKSASIQDSGTVTSSTGLWHETSMDGKTGVWYYGQEPAMNYDTGYVVDPYTGIPHNSGDLVLTFDLSLLMSPTLTFETKWGTEGGSYYDKCQILVGSDILWERSDAMSDWTTMSLDLGAYAGSMSVAVTFHFDTLDSVANNYFGWAVYNVDMIGSTTGGGGTGTAVASITQLDINNFPMIDVFMTVSDADGNAVPGLTESNFEVSEDGTPVYDFTVSSLTGDPEPLSLGMVIDQSGSMYDSMDDVKLAVKDFIDLSTGAQDQFGLISIGSSAASLTNQVEVIQDFTTDKDLLKSKVDPLVADSMTPLYDGIAKALELTAMQPGMKAVIAFTDGYDTYSIDYNELTVIDYADSLGIPVYTIGLGYVDATILTKIAEQTGGFYTPAASASDLLGIYKSLLTAITNQYKITYETPSPDMDGTERCVTIKANLPDGSTASATDCYYADMPPQIVLDDDTKDAISEGVPYSASLTIGAIVTADLNKGKTIQDVSLFYRPNEPGTASLTYSAITFEKVSMDQDTSEPTIYTVQILDYADPGIEFYITASDGELTNKEPDTDFFVVNGDGIDQCPVPTQIYKISPKDNAVLSWGATGGQLSFSFSAISGAAKYVLHLKLVDILYDMGIPLYVPLLPPTAGGPWGGGGQGTPGFDITLGIASYVIQLDSATWDALGLWDIKWGVEAYENESDDPNDPDVCLLGCTYKAGVCARYVDDLKLFPSNAVALTSPGNGGQMNNEQESAPVFKWELYTGADLYNIILAHVGTVGFDNVLSESVGLNVFTMDSSAWAAMPDGTWYWTVFGNDAAGNQVAPQFVIFEFEVL